MKNQKKEKSIQGDQNGAVLVRHRNDFYRDGFRKLISITIIFTVIAMMSIAGNIYSLTRDPVVQNFAMSEEGRIVPLVPLHEAYLNQAAVLAFAQKAATEPWNLDYVKYVNQLAQTKPLFTNNGYKSFLDAMQKSGNIDLMKAEEMIFYASAPLPPVIVSEGKHEGRYIWKVEVPVKLTMEGRKGRKSTDLLIRMIITRVPVVDNPKGVAVDLYLSQEKSLRS